MDRLECSTLSVPPQVPPGSDSPVTAGEEALARLAERIDGLHRFCVLTYIGFFKLVKKWNKHSEPERRIEAVPLLLAQPLFSSRTLMSLLQRASRALSWNSGITPAPSVVPQAAAAAPVPRAAGVGGLKACALPPASACRGPAHARPSAWPTSAARCPPRPAPHP